MRRSMRRSGHLVFLLSVLLAPLQAIAREPAPAGHRFAASDATNSERNASDRNKGALTPIDQGQTEGDIKITQAIRKAVVAKDSFSSDAKNVKIITNDGVVTLRGPVETAEEKASIVAIAYKQDGVRTVVNQIEIEQPD